MPAFTRPVGSFGESEHIEVPDDLAAYYRAHPEYVEVVPVDGHDVPADQADTVREALADRAEVAAQVADLTGDKLDAAVKAAGIEGASGMKADEKRTALLEHKLTGVADAADYDTPED